METTTEPIYNDELETIRLEFIEEHEAGKRPTLESYTRRYPQYTAPLTDFVLDFLRLENATKNVPLPETASPEAERGMARALAALGISQPPLTLAEARKARGWETFELAQKLRLPNALVIELERGRITDAPRRLLELLAATFETRRETVAGWLAESRPRALAAAYLAEDGSPDVAAVQANRAQTVSFAEALAGARLKPDQKSFWADPERPLSEEEHA